MFEFIGSLVIIALILLGSMTCGYVRCENARSELERQTKWTVVQGCLVKGEHGWLPLKQLRDE